MLFKNKIIFVASSNEWTFNAFLEKLMYKREEF